MILVIVVLIPVGLWAGWLLGDWLFDLEKGS